MMESEGIETRGLSKIRELIRRQRPEYEEDWDDVTSSELTILDFTYEDADSYSNEISELYSYTEVAEFNHNFIAYTALLTSWDIPIQWQKLSLDLQKSAILRLVNQLELSNKILRAEAVRAVLYIAQGCWNEVESVEEQQKWTRYNVTLLIQEGVFHAIVDLLSLESECKPSAIQIQKSAVSLNDSVDLRVILSILYTIVETIRCKSPDEEDFQFEEIRQSFKIELAQPIRDELLATKLVNMIVEFGKGSAPHFPIKKVLLLLWKVILVSVGGTPELRELKAKYRELAGLPAVKEDTIEVSKTMRPTSPPSRGIDLLSSQSNRRFKGRRSLIKQSGLEVTMDWDMSDSNEEEVNEIEERRAMEESGELPEPPSPRPMTPPPPKPKDKGTPWTPKVRQKDLDAFLETSRLKFLDLIIQGDSETLVGLPAPIHESVKVLKQHMYTALSEWQIQREDELWRCPLTTSSSSSGISGEIPHSDEFKALYAAIFPPNLSTNSKRQFPNKFIVALLKVLLAATPTSRIKSESLNIMAEVLPDELPLSVVDSMKLDIDVARHKEIIVKATSAIFLLLLKHAKINHVYQFEFISQHLVFANCIQLVLKFFNQNTITHITATNTIASMEFPLCILAENTEMTQEALEARRVEPYSWRNLYTCINLLRILNKLTKWKNSRIMMMVVLKAAPILKRSLRVKQALLQLYILKLLKMQSKYLGKQWRRTNMKTMSAIYQKVRHRLMDDWAYGNDVDVQPWDFQSEESALRIAIDRFNTRNAEDNSKLLSDFEPTDKSVMSVLGGSPVHLTNVFKENYEVWLEQEVFKNPVNWDELMKCKGIM